MSSVWTCEAKPIARIAASSGSAFSAAIVAIGSVFGLFRSKMTSVGCSARACASISSRRLRERDLDAEVFRGRADLGAEEEVVDGREDRHAMDDHTQRPGQRVSSL